MYNHLQNAKYLGSMKPFSAGDWIPREGLSLGRGFFFLVEQDGKKVVIFPFLESSGSCLVNKIYAIVLLKINSERGWKPSILLEITHAFNCWISFMNKHVVKTYPFQQLGIVCTS